MCIGGVIGLWRRMRCKVRYGYELVGSSPEIYT
jgi:hypothetical protein